MQLCKFKSLFGKFYQLVCGFVFKPTLFNRIFNLFPQKKSFISISFNLSVQFVTIYGISWGKIWSETSDQWKHFDILHLWDTHHRHPYKHHHYHTSSMSSSSLSLSYVSSISSQAEPVGGAGKPLSGWQLLAQVLICFFVFL